MKHLCNRVMCTEHWAECGAILALGVVCNAETRMYCQYTNVVSLRTGCNALNCSLGNVHYMYMYCAQTCTQSVRSVQESVCYCSLMCHCWVQSYMENSSTRIGEFVLNSCATLVSTPCSLGVTQEGRESAKRCRLWSRHRGRHRLLPHRNERSDSTSFCTISLPVE